MSYRHLKPLAAAILMTLAGASAHAAEPLTLVVPYPPGGSQDAIGRYFADKLGNKLDATVIVKNVGGAGGVIGASEVARSKGDGHTLLLATGGAITIAPYIQKSLPYDVNRDLTAVALVADTPMAIGVRADSKYQNLQDLLKDAEAHPGSVSYASTGSGTVSHLAAELLSQSMHIDMLHVPYRGAGPGLVDLQGGQVQAIFTSMASLKPLVTGGKARFLAAFSDPGEDDKVATVAQETGNAALDVPVWVGVMAPKSTPADMLAKLGLAFHDVCETAETQQFMGQQGGTAKCGDAAALQQIIDKDAARWKSVVEKSPGIAAN